MADAPTQYASSLIEALRAATPSDQTNNPGIRFYATRTATKSAPLNFQHASGPQTFQVVDLQYPTYVRGPVDNEGSGGTGDLGTEDTGVHTGSTNDNVDPGNYWLTIAPDPTGDLTTGNDSVDLTGSGDSLGFDNSPVIDPTVPDDSEPLTNGASVEDRAHIEKAPSTDEFAKPTPENDNIVDDTPLEVTKEDNSAPITLDEFTVADLPFEPDTPAAEDHPVDAADMGGVGLFVEEPTISEAPPASDQPAAATADQVSPVIEEQAPAPMSLRDVIEDVVAQQSTPDAGNEPAAAADLNVSAEPEPQPDPVPMSLRDTIENAVNEQPASNEQPEPAPAPVVESPPAAVDQSPAPMSLRDVIEDVVSQPAAPVAQPEPVAAPVSEPAQEMSSSQQSPQPPAESSPDAGLVDAVAVADAVGIPPAVAENLGITEDTSVAVASVPEPMYDPAMDVLYVPPAALDTPGNEFDFNDFAMSDEL